MTDSRQALTVHPVPAMGAEDVVVADDGTVYTGTEDGAIWALDAGTGSTRRVADTGGRPLGLELLRRRRPARLRRHARACCASTPAPAPVEVLLDRRRGRADEVLQQRRGRRATAPSGSATPRATTASSSGRTTSSRTPAPAACCAATPTAPSRSCSTGWPSPTASRSRRTSPSSAWPSCARARRTPLADRTARRRARPPRERPPRLPRQHQPRQRRADLGRASPARVDGLVERLGSAPMLLRKAVTRIPEALQPKPKRTIRVQAYDTDGRAGARPRPRPPGLPHGHRGAGARRPGLDGQPARAGGGRPRPGMK